MIKNLQHHKSSGQPQWLLIVMLAGFIGLFVEAPAIQTIGNDITIEAVYHHQDGSSYDEHWHDTVDNAFKKHFNSDLTYHGARIHEHSVLTSVQFKVNKAAQKISQSTFLTNFRKTLDHNQNDEEPALS